MDEDQQEQSSQFAIRSTLEAYFSSVDRRDWQTYGQCFAEDATVQYNHGTVETVSGRDAIVRRAADRTNRPVSNHLLSNAHIEIDDRHARAVTHAIAHLVVSRGEEKIIVVRGIVYDDELSKTADGVWQISKRSHRPLWQFEAPAMPLGY